MALEDEKALARGALEIFVGAHEGDVLGVVSADYVNHQEPAPSPGRERLDLEAWQALVSEFQGAFPGSTVEVLHQLAEGDLVATHWRIRATPTGAFLGQAPTGKEIAWTGIVVDRVEGGRLAESWVSWDRYTFSEGLGLIG